MLKIAVGALLLWFVVRKMSPGWQTSKQLIVQLFQSNIHLLALGVLCFGAVLLIGIYRWQLLLFAHKIRLTTIDAAKLLFVGHFFSQFMPGGIAGGDIVKSYYVTNHTDDRKHEAVTTIFIDRIIGTLGLLGVLVIAILANIGSVGYTKYVVIVLLFLGVCSLLMLIVFNKRLMKKIWGITRLADRMPYREFIARIYNAFHYYKDHKSVILLTFIMSVLVHFILAVMTYCVGRGLGLETPFKKYLILVSLVNFIGSIPVSPLGTVGTLDGAYIFFFEGETVKGSGIPGALALMVRLIYALWGVVGLIIWFFMKSQFRAKNQKTAGKAASGENLNT